MNLRKFLELNLSGLLLIVGVHKTSSSSSLPSKTRNGTKDQDVTTKDNNCLKYDYQIHDALASMTPPFDNYFNISRAIFPSEDISSKLINIWVHFTNSSLNLSQVDERKYIWSRSCLYVSDRYLSLRAMTLYSLGAIWPDRRQEDLHITIYNFCHPEDAVRRLIPFLTTLEDVAMNPSQHNPSLNNVQCVVFSSSLERFADVKRAFPHICWFFWIFSLVGSYWANVFCIYFIKDNKNKDVVKTTLLFIFIVLLFGLTVALIALSSSTKKYQGAYPSVVCLSIILHCFFGFLYCKYHLGLKCEFCRAITFSRDIDTLSQLDKKYRPLVFTVYPGLFIGIHHFLWILIGITTEPFWAIPVATSFVAVTFLIFFLAFFYVSEERKWDALDIFHLAILVITILSIVLVLFSFFLTGQQFFDDSFLSSVIPGILIVILSVWWKGYKKESSSTVEPLLAATSP